MSGHPWLCRRAIAYSLCSSWRALVCQRVALARNRYSPAAGHSADPGRDGRRTVAKWSLLGAESSRRAAAGTDASSRLSDGGAIGAMAKPGWDFRLARCRWPAARPRPSRPIRPAPSCPGRRRVCRCRPIQQRLAAAASHGTPAVTQTARVEDHEETVDRGIRAPGLLVWRKIRVSASAAASRAPTLLSARTWQLAA